MNSPRGSLVAGAPQQGRPDDGVELEDVLGQQVDVGRPVAPLRVVARPRVGKRRDVVDERVDPDVDHLLGIPGHGDAPGDRLAADRDVVEAALDERQGLVVARAAAAPSRDWLEVELGAAGPGSATAGSSSSPLRARPARCRAPGTCRRRGRARSRRPRRRCSRGRRRCASRCRRRPCSRSTKPLHVGLVLGVGRADEEVVAGVHAAGQLAELRRQARRRAARGVRPRSSAAWATLLPCSSVPVRKKTSSPSWR